MTLRSLLLILAATVLPAALPTRTETRLEALPMGAKLWIAQVDGKVDVQGWDRPEVELVAEFVQGTHHEEAKLEVRRVAEGLEIEVKRRKRFCIILFGTYHEPVINLTLRVPRRLSMVAHAVDGDIKVRELEGYAGCNTVDGDIDVQNVSGEVHARTVDGAITARDLKARLKGGTVDGSITLARVEGGLDLETVDGSITAEALDGWGEGIALHTVDGNITVKLGQAKGNLEARAVDGAIKAHLPGSTYHDNGSNRFTCAIPGRDQKITFKTVDGDIEIN